MLHFALHGYGVSLDVRAPQLLPVAGAILAPMLEDHLPVRSTIEGAVLPYDEADVLRHVASDAERLEEVDPLLELYRSRDGERFWLVDERWGLCEINLLKRSFRSWILAEPSCDAVRLFESVIWWPMSHLLRGFGLHLIPAAALGTAGKGVLILSPFDVGPEVQAVADAGVGVIAQRWTVLRQEADERVSLLWLPGRTELTPAPRLLSSGPADASGWVDAAAGRTCHHAYCDLVLVVEPMRRTQASDTPVTAAAARELLKQIWPIPQLSAGASPTAPTHLLAAALAKTSPVHKVRLSRRGTDLAQMLVRPTAPAPLPLRAAA